MNIKKYIRPCCNSFEPYSAGRPIEQIKRELGLKKVVKLASNENPLGPSKRAILAMKNAASKAYFYPDSNSYELKNALSKKFKIPMPQILLGAGSDEIIELIAKTFFNPGDEIVVSESVFIRYKMVGNLMNCKVVSVPMKNYTHNLSAMFARVNRKTKAVFIVNPNNPTGTYNTKNEIEGFLSALYKKFGSAMPIVVIDEAYYEFANINKDYPQTLKLIEKYPQLIVLRTFSKIYALAGLRIGYGFTSQQVAGYIDRIRPPFNINTQANVAAIASLQDTLQVIKSIALVEKEKKRLYKFFDSLNIEYIPSAGNFILIKTAPKKGTKVFKELLKKGVIARAMDEYNLFEFLRVSIGLVAENTFFMKALKKVINK
ncbi:MAG: histidinol-phosphate transaminase [Endomicrobiales bacterium]|nr:histidinol-phosphate transaminase [Endomicrobiales bacterium]